MSRTIKEIDLGGTRNAAQVSVRRPCSPPGNKLVLTGAAGYAVLSMRQARALYAALQTFDSEGLLDGE